MSQIHADIANIGGGLGGVTAALAAPRLRSMALSEQYDWLGGRLTSRQV